jgi:hypothetical protein
LSIRIFGWGSMKLRGWLLMLLFVHVMLHPWVHAVGTAGAGNHRATVSDTSKAPASGLAAADQCELCRVGHNATVTAGLAKTDLLNPRWIRTTLQAVNYASLQADRSLPSRAPPTL